MLQFADSWLRFTQCRPVSEISGLNNFQEQSLLAIGWFIDRLLKEFLILLQNFPKASPAVIILKTLLG